MAPDHILILGAVGLAVGFIAGLIGIGGGAFFAPVLLFYFDAAGVPDAVIAQFTIASSLLCSLLTASSSAAFRHRKGAVNWRIAGVTGISSVVAILLMTTLVTTRPWYGRDLFQIAFSLILLVVAYRMIRADGNHPDESETPNAEPGRILAAGSLAGTISSAVGVGGGIVLVPLYERFVRLPIHKAMGTSSATVILITLIGIISYASIGPAEGASSLSVGYVDVGTALMLAVPAMITAGLGVRLSHRIDRKMLRRVFAVIAIAVALRLAWGAAGL